MSEIQQAMDDMVAAITAFYKLSPPARGMFLDEISSDLYDNDWMRNSYDSGHYDSVCDCDE